MKPEAQRIAIAEVYGYRYPCPSCFNNGYKDRWRNLADTGCVGLSDLPDYLNDLNAMHDALSQLKTDGSWGKYRNALCTITNTLANDGNVEWFLEHNATAAQRAEAFLRTLGLWID